MYLCNRINGKWYYKNVLLAIEKFNKSFPKW